MSGCEAFAKKAWTNNLGKLHDSWDVFLFDLLIQQLACMYVYAQVIALAYWAHE
jgi:hypothetical protein